MIDYGAIAFKNGKLISTGMFTPMIDMVGWEDTEKDKYHNYTTKQDTPLRLNKNYFAYIGDSAFTIAFYKEQLVIVRRHRDETFYYEHVFFNNTDFIWSKWERWFASEECGNIKVTKRNGYLVCKWKYKGDRYKVYFGYGVDYRYYKKWKIVNYFRSPEYRFYEIRRWIDDKIYDWKYLIQQKR